MITHSWSPLLFMLWTHDSPAVWGILSRYMCLRGTFFFSLFYDLLLIIHISLPPKCTKSPVNGDSNFSGFIPEVCFYSCWKIVLEMEPRLVTVRESNTDIYQLFNKNLILHKTFVSKNYSKSVFSWKNT